ncbi:hypothetical protein ACJ73_09147, partial [Blastomyces percursus]
RRSLKVSRSLFVGAHAYVSFRRKLYLRMEATTIHSSSVANSTLPHPAIKSHGRRRVLLTETRATKSSLELRACSVATFNS